MKLTSILLLTAFLQVSAHTYSQRVTLQVRNTSLPAILQAIRQQTGYNFVYNLELLRAAKPVTLTLTDVPVETALTESFREQPFTFEISHRSVIVKPLETTMTFPVYRLVKGVIKASDGKALNGITISIKGSQHGTHTDSEGRFEISAEPGDVLVLSGIGYESQEIRVGAAGELVIVLKEKVSLLDENVVVAYGTTTRRLNTGSVGRVAAEEIARNPVTNPLMALEGRVAGLVVTQTNGIPGSAVKVQIRGQNTIGVSVGARPFDDPLFIIDGVPFAPNNTSTNQLSSAVGSNGLSPFNSINPGDIESIEVLKDADATAIYGSRGANGVILITTKKAKAGKTAVTLNVQKGISRAAATTEWLNTAQYLAMRKAAFFNDGVAPSGPSAQDLLLYDSNRYTDWKKEFIGGTATTTDADLSLNGGSENTQVSFGSAWHHETTVFPGNLAYQRGSFRVNAVHSSPDKRLLVNLTASYSADLNHITTLDFTNYVKLPPNYPALLDQNGDLVWKIGNEYLYFDNPLAGLKGGYSSRTKNLLSNLQIGYRILRGWTLKASGGYNLMTVDETSTRPKAANSPEYGSLGSANFGASKISSWIAEPQTEYHGMIGKGKLTVLAGATWQQSLNKGNYIDAFNYNNDALINSVSGAGTVNVYGNYSEYKYSAMFGRINYNVQDKYLVNLTARRDGSSRFGPGKQFTDFGAAAVAWIFTEEAFMKKIPFISFGKLRGSYGVTGSDAIGNYGFLDTWKVVSNKYQASTGLYPTRLFNTDYSWQSTRKLEAALELGILKDRVLLSVAYFRNRCGNQLIAYKLPSITGFTSISRNFPAVVQNKGLEVQLNAAIIQQHAFSWSTTVNLTLYRNKLLEFPNLASSSYASSLVVGKSLSSYKGYVYKGVNPQTGIYEFDDRDASGTLTVADQVQLGNLDPKYYGSISNTFAYKGISLDLFFEFRRQNGYSYLYKYAANVPGTYPNQPVAVLNNWQQPGDIADMQKYTTTFGSAAYTAASVISNTGTSANYTDASFIRMKNVALSWQLPSSWTRKAKMDRCRIYLQAQNLFVITPYKGTDPETQSFGTLPPLRTMTAGIQFFL